jgi:hypothetical protein
MFIWSSGLSSRWYRIFVLTVFGIVVLALVIAVIAIILYLVWGSAAPV